jgi:hypothetical protein
MPSFEFPSSGSSRQVDADNPWTNWPILPRRVFEKQPGSTPREYVGKRLSPVPGFHILPANRAAPIYPHTLSDNKFGISLFANGLDVLFSIYPQIDNHHH